MKIEGAKQFLQYIVEETPRLCTNIQYMYDVDMAWAHLFCFSPPAVSEV